MTTPYKSNGVDLDDIFEPYTTGTKAAITGYPVGGQDLRDRYAPLSMGSAAAITGYKTYGADLNTKFAAKGSVSYSLPINGQTFTQSTNITSGNTGYAQIGFRIVTGNTWQVFGYNSITAATTILASGAIPSGAVNVQYTFGTPSVPANQSNAGGGTTNNASAPTAVSSNPNAFYQTATNTATSGSRALSYPFTIDLFNSGGSNISHTAITLIGETEGSV